MTNHETNTSATIFDTYNVPRSFEREWLLSHDYAETPDYGKHRPHCENGHRSYGKVYRYIRGGYHACWECVAAKILTDYVAQ